ncbi:F0F1 ATP synthase subunit gamma [Parabacteroides faecis]|uniref:F0F1 ATP synthase subunit gamma n=1 Tax=Parabacteroides faecis TaxID=1217282 RepID=UPI0021642CA4|nr:F0F1 ATP synthase subunit gamma [Parabacteroides faecis]MCS2891178.1 F0F1 ATP synthase subunit gamma [Parabacteroides faecis]UVQ45173.1 F0F1 ATP synthase subunit gamma [Parabacteroides faecis]
MSSLKEIKVRLASIRNTQKITSAMKMVSSAKLHHTQTIIEHLLVYENKLSAILSGTLSAENDLNSPYTAVRKVKQVAIVAFSSNTGLCGVFNANVWKELAARLHQYEADGIAVRIYPIGKKIADELHKAGYQTDDSFLTIGDKPAYDDAARLATALMDLYTTGQADRVELLYHHFKNMAEQVLTEKTFLPVTLPETDPAKESLNYILEPSAEQLLALLLPKVLHLHIYTTLLDTVTAEHAARMLAMQTANDNANDLIQELTLQYNKTRQQAITNELLDIMGGSGQ